MVLQVSASIISSTHAMKCPQRFKGVNIDETTSVQAPGETSSLLLLYCMTNCDTVQNYSLDIISIFIFHIQSLHVWLPSANYSDHS